MTFPRLVGLAAVVLLVVVAVAVSQANGAATTLALPGLPTFIAPLWVLLFMATLVGAGLTTAYVGALSSRDALAHWRQSRLDRQVARLDRMHDEGVRALVGGDLERARVRFDEVTSQAPERGESWLLAGEAARTAGDGEAATELHLRAQGLMPDEPRVLEALSRDAEQVGDLARALRYQDQLIERHGGTLERRERQRDLAIADGDWKTALAAEQECSRGRRRNAEEERLLRALRLESAALDLAAGDIEPGLMAVQRLANEAPEFEPVHDVLAAAHRANDDHSAALEALERGFAATGSLQLLRLTVKLQIELEQPEAAIAMLRAAPDALEGDAAVAARIMLGRLYDRLGLAEEAEQEFETLADTVESSAVVDYYRAKIRARRNDHALAYSLLRDAIRRGGFLDYRFRCRACGEDHDEYHRRCRSCSAWATLAMETTRDAHAAEPVVAPTV